MFNRIIITIILVMFIFSVNMNAKNLDKSTKKVNKHKTSKKPYFTFIDTYAEIEKKNKKAEVFEYENQDRFKFKFQSSLSEGNNIANPGGGSGSGAGMGSGGASAGGGQGAGGGRQFGGGRR